MSNRVVNTPVFEAKELWDQVCEREEFLLIYFFELNNPPDGISKEDYMRDLKEEYYKLKREEARRLLGLDKK